MNYVTGVIDFGKVMSSLYWDYDDMKKLILDDARKRYNLDGYINPVDSIKLDADSSFEELQGYAEKTLFKNRYSSDSDISGLDVDEQIGILCGGSYSVPSGNQDLICFSWIPETTQYRYCLKYSG